MSADEVALLALVAGDGVDCRDEIMKLVASMQTIKRPSTPVDAANALSFLVSEDAGFITGQILHVDGGFSRSGA